MVSWSENPLTSLADIQRFEQEMPLRQRLPGDSIYDVLVEAAKAHGDRTALRMLKTGAEDESARCVSFVQLLGLVRQAANLFSSLGGARPGVAYMLPTLVETHAVLWGAETAGYAVPINFLLQPDHIQGLLEASGATVLVTLGPHPQLDIWEKSLELKRQIPNLILVRVAPPGSEPVDGVIDFFDALANQPNDHLVFDQYGRGDDVAAYFHTGGTTGVPKLAAHTHNGQLAAAFGCAALMNLKSDDVLTGTLPMFHVAGTILMGISTFLAGAELVLMSPAGLRNPAMVSQFWRLCERYKVTIPAGVPTSIGAVAEAPVDGADLSSIRCGLTGASLLPVAVREKFVAIIGKPLNEIYGMTEASGLIACNPFAGEEGVGSVGFRFPYTQITIRRPDMNGDLGDICNTDEVGVLVVEGPTVSPGYRNSAQSAGTFVNGGLVTGDLAYADAQGRIYIAGRSKDLIIRSGHNIDPLMIENAMQNHPAVAVAAAVGRPDSYAGEIPVCYVQLKPDTTASDEELRTHAEATIAERPAWPKYIHVIPAIPLTAVGKVFKPALRKDAVERSVVAVLSEQNLDGAKVLVEEGGTRGMIVNVKLAHGDVDDAQQLQETLNGYLFKTKITRS
ncbi:MAG: fatty-acyl-CoA synthase [Parasphingorhabdus sp.]|jgi:fatty-acyl-CoA synthase